MELTFSLSSVASYRCTCCVISGVRASIQVSGMTVAKGSSRKGLRGVVACRRAQQKCRERQKHKLQESEARAQELQRELKQLKAQKSALEARNVLLERMVGQQESGSQPCLQVQAERTPEEVHVPTNSSQKHRPPRPLLHIRWLPEFLDLPGPIQARSKRLRSCAHFF